MKVSRKNRPSTTWSWKLWHWQWASNHQTLGFLKEGAISNALDVVSSPPPSEHARNNCNVLLESGASSLVPSMLATTFTTVSL
eukprot:5585220-Pyramimonas_sp.AAC.1